jgi:hypothetical protein
VLGSNVGFAEESLVVILFVDIEVVFLLCSFLTVERLDLFSFKETI